MRGNLWIGAIILGLIMGAVGVSRAAGEEGVTRIGVVDMVKVFDEYNKAKDLETGLKEEGTKFKEKADAMKAELDQLKVKMDMLNQNSPEFTKTKIELAAKAAGYDGYVKQEGLRLKTEQASLMWSIYQDICGKITDYAQKGGYTLILKADSPDVASTSPEEVQLRIATREVIYFSSLHDLTDSIIKVLNESYEAGVKAGTTGQPEEPKPQETKGGNDAQGNS